MGTHEVPGGVSDAPGSPVLSPVKWTLKGRPGPDSDYRESLTSPTRSATEGHGDVDESRGGGRTDPGGRNPTV